MYKGSMEDAAMQKVYCSKTQEGIPGLFTNGYLVMLIRDMERFKADPNTYCERLGFQYTARGGAVKP